MKNKLIYFFLRYINGIALPRDLIRFAVKRYADAVAVVDGQVEVTYKELYLRAVKLADALTKANINKGDRLGILIYNCRHYFEIRLATYLAGIVLVPLSRDLSGEDIILIANDCAIKAFIYHAPLLEGRMEALKEKTLIGFYLSIDETENAYEHFLAQGKPVVPNIPLAPDDLASINFSSGTTGRPKGIQLSQKNWLASFYQYLLNSQVALKTHFSFLHIIPLATAGSTAVLPCFAKGAKSIITNDFDAGKIVSLINARQITRVFLTPSWFIALLEYCRTKAIRLPSLEGIIVGTAPLASQRLKEGIEYFGPIIEIGYGMAEILPPLFLLNANDYWEKGMVKEEKLSSVGKQLKGVEVKIVDANRQILTDNQVGEIVLKSKTISQGYGNNEDLTKVHYKDGWFYSDDFGYLDEEGYLFVLGRRRDVIKGDADQMHFAREVEEILHTHANILEASVYLDDAQLIQARISLRDKSQKLSEKEIQEFCKNKLPDSLIPVKIVICQQQPTKTTGKIDIFRGHTP